MKRFTLKIATQNRKGDTLIDIIVAFSIFIIIMLSILSSALVSTQVSKSVEQYGRDMHHIRNITFAVQNSFESAQRMAVGSFSPNLTYHLYYKRFHYDPSHSKTDSYWTQLFVENGSTYGKVYYGQHSVIYSQEKVDSSKYFWIDAFTPDNILEASNHQSIHTIHNVNDYPIDFWRVTIIGMYNRLPVVITAERGVTPFFERPTVVSNSSSSYRFNLPLDTSRTSIRGLSGVSYPNDVTLNTSSNAATVDKYIPYVSSYIGVPAVKPTVISNFHKTQTGYEGYLYDALTGSVPTDSKGHAIPAVVYAVASSGQVMSTVPIDDTGKFDFIGIGQPAEVIFFGRDNDKYGGNYAGYVYDVASNNGYPLYP